MKAWALAAAIVIASPATGTNSPQPHLVTRIEAGDTSKNSSGLIRVVITNDGDADAYTAHNQVPETNSDSRLLNSIVKVVGLNGAPAVYRGIFAPSRPSISGWVVIRKGEEKSYEVDIAKNFDIVAGGYSITYSPMSYTDASHTKSDNPEVLSTKPSVPLEIWFTTDAARR